MFQLVIGFLLRERPMFALAAVATAVVSRVRENWCKFGFTQVWSFGSNICAGNMDNLSLCGGCIYGFVPLHSQSLLHERLVLLVTTQYQYIERCKII